MAVVPAAGRLAPATLLGGGLEWWRAAGREPTSGEQAGPAFARAGRWCRPQLPAAGRYARTWASVPAASARNRRYGYKKGGVIAQEDEAQDKKLIPKIREEGQGQRLRIRTTETYRHGRSPTVVGQRRGSVGARCRNGQGLSQLRAAGYRPLRLRAWFDRVSRTGSDGGEHHARVRPKSVLSCSGELIRGSSEAVRSERQLLLKDLRAERMSTTSGCYKG